MIYISCYKKLYSSFLQYCFLLALISGCNSPINETAIFEVLKADKTGLDFNNNLTYNKDFNLFKYIYFYNGSGVGAGDFNNDGLIDLFFGSNLV